MADPQRSKPSQREQPKRVVINGLLKTGGLLSIFWLLGSNLITLLGKWAGIESIGEGFFYIGITITVFAGIVGVACWSIVESTAKIE